MSIAITSYLCYDTIFETDDITSTKKTMSDFMFPCQFVRRPADAAGRRIRTRDNFWTTFSHFLYFGRIFGPDR